MIKTSSASENQDSGIFIRPLASLLVIFFLVGPGAVTSLAQASVEEFQNSLSAQAGLTVDDWSSLKRGGVVVRLLPAADKREVRVYGLAHVQATPEVVLKAFQESMVQHNSESILSKGKFSNPPTQVDVETISLENSDIEDLKQCVVGKCELKISAGMIGRFKSQVKWDSLDYRSQTNRLFREMLLDYVRDYQTRGDEGLIEYYDQRRAVSVRDEQQALLDRMLYVHDFAPEFANHLKQFPYSKLPNVESHISWTKLKFGVKPVIMVTHVVTYQPPHSRQVITVSRQIYANHYFDSSLAMTAVLSIPTSTGGPGSYLLYTNYSRSDSLTGSFSRLRRGLVETESVENLNVLLQQTRANLDVANTNPSGSDPTGQHLISERLFQGARLYAWLFALLVLGVLIVLSRRSARTI